MQPNQYLYLSPQSYQDNNIKYFPFQAPIRQQPPNTEYTDSSISSNSKHKKLSYFTYTEQFILINNNSNVEFNIQPPLKIIYLT